MKDDIKELIKLKVSSEDTFADEHELYEHLDYDGSLHELIDSSIDVYYYDIRQWAVDNWEYVEDAIAEGLTEGVEDYHKLIQCGQYMKLSEEAREAVGELYNEFFNEEEVAA